MRYDCLCLCLCLCFEFISSHIVCRYSGTGTQIMVHIIKNIYVGNNVLHSKPVFTKFSRVLLCMYQPPSTRLGMKCGINCVYFLVAASPSRVKLWNKAGQRVVALQRMGVRRNGTHVLRSALLPPLFCPVPTLRDIYPISPDLPFVSQGELTAPSLDAAQGHQETGYKTRAKPRTKTHQVFCRQVESGTTSAPH